MNDPALDNVNVSAESPILTPDALKALLPLTPSARQTVLESNLEWGNQPIPRDVSQLRYGVSVTDACIDWATTEKTLREARAKLHNLLSLRHSEPASGLR